MATEARRQALEQVQRRLADPRALGPWLARHGMTNAPALWRRIRVDAGWEPAIEAVLRERLGALDAGRADRLAALAADAAPARCAFFVADATGHDKATGPADGAGSAGAPGAPGAEDASLVPLANRVQAAEATIGALIEDWLHGLHAADSVEAALAARSELAPGRALVTPQGHVVRRDSLQLHAPDGERDGLLARQREIDALAATAVAQRADVDAMAERLRQGEAELSAHEAARRAADDAHVRAAQEAAAAALADERLSGAQAQAQRLVARLQAELDEIAAAAAEQQAARALQTEAIQAAQARLQAHRSAWPEAQQAEALARAALDAATQRLRALERDAQRAEFACQAIAERIERSERDAADARSRIEQADHQASQATQRLASLDERAAREALERAEAGRLRAEQSLGAAREALDAVAAEWREAEQARTQAERAQTPLRERLGRLRLDEQAARLSADELERHLTEAGCDEAQLRAGWAATPDPAWLQARLAELAERIDRLGAVNLAALEELSEVRERSVGLEAQAADLREAVATLEDAIRRIDRETRALLQDTFDKVDAEFGRLFPLLFGGGRARLVLGGDEILDAGVTVVAQPPGKRNGTIALLSGGEKALAAIALVFAMFQLNPAPFCLLDEVDAPLDDANTERYVQLVRQMSAQTQFLFITHNKIAMELAQHLVGVTMQERGVSRIVAVDLQAAGQMARAA